MGKDYKAILIKEQEEYKKIMDPRNVFHLYWFECMKKEDGEDFHRGTVILGIEKRVEARFFTVSELGIGVSLSDCCVVSRFLTVPNVIKVYGFGLDWSVDDVPNEAIFVAYEAFDDTYKSWAAKNRNKMDQEWWIEMIRKILEAMYMMSIKGVYHEELENIDSYLIVNDELHLTHVAKIVFAKDRDERPIVERKCLQSLKEFLVSQAKETLKHLCDWEYFEKTIDICTIDQLRKSPLLLTDIERYKYCRQQTSFIKNYMNQTQRDELKNRLKDHGGFDSWQVWIETTGNFFMILNHRQGASMGQAAFNLLKLLEMALDHYDENVQPTPRDELGRMIAATFPGFLTLVHHHFIDMHRDVNHFPHAFRITSYHWDRLPSFQRAKLYG